MDIMLFLVPIGALMALASVVVGVIVLAKGNKSGNDVDHEGENIQRAKLSNKFMRYRVIIQGVVLGLIAIAFLASK